MFSTYYLRYTGVYNENVQAGSAISGKSFVITLFDIMAQEDSDRNSQRPYQTLVLLSNCENVNLPYTLETAW
jgi:hypothetical protein